MIEIKYATEADIPGLAAVNILSNTSNPIITNTFPSANINALLLYSKDSTYSHISNPTTHLLAGVDPETNKIVAYCRWIIPSALGYDRDPVPFGEEGVAALANPMRNAPQPMNHDAYDGFKKMLEEGRKKYLRDGDINLVSTLPEYRGKGIASGMIQWGLEKADTVHARIYLEAVPKAVPLYTRLGWRPLEEMRIDFDDFGGEKGAETWVAMGRDPS